MLNILNSHSRSCCHSFSDFTIVLKCEKKERMKLCVQTFDCFAYVCILCVYVCVIFSNFRSKSFPHYPVIELWHTGPSCVTASFLFLFTFPWPCVVDSFYPET